MRVEGCSKTSATLRPSSARDACGSAFSAQRAVEQRRQLARGELGAGEEVPRQARPVYPDAAARARLSPCHTERSPVPLFPARRGPARALSRPRPTSASSRASTPPTRAATGRCFARARGPDRGRQARRRRRARGRRRDPGDIFGEVPITLGTVFPVGFRAAEPSRVMRARAARLPRRRLRRRPTSRKEVGRLAAHRMCGPARAAGRSPPTRRRRARSSSATAWTPACTELRRFLDRNQVTFHWLSPDTPGRRGALGRPAARRRATCPTFRVVDGKTVIRPRHRRVAELLDARHRGRARPTTTRSSSAPGPAGLAAAVYGASEGLRTLVVEREAPGGQAGTSSRIENYLGFPAGRLRRRARQPRAPAGAPPRRRDPRHPLDPAHRRRDTRQVHLDGGDVLRARTIILACGVAWRQLPIDGLRAARGQRRLLRRVAQRGARTSTAQDVHIVGAGNSAGPGGAVLLHARDAASRSSAAAPRSEKSMSRYLIDQLGDARRTSTRASAPRSSACTRRRVARGDRRPRHARRGEVGGSTPAACSSSSAPTPRRAGCRRRSRSTSAASCSRAPTCATPDRWTARPRPLPARDQRAGRLRLRRRPLRPGQARRRRRRRGQHGDRLRAPVPEEAATAAARSSPHPRPDLEPLPRPRAAGGGAAAARRVRPRARRLGVGRRAAAGGAAVVAGPLGRGDAARAARMALTSRNACLPCAGRSAPATPTC